MTDTFIHEIPLKSLSPREYEKLMALRLLKDIFDIHMPDFTYGYSEHGQRYFSEPPYMETTMATFC